MRLAVLGGGAWGTTVAHLCAHNASTTLWARDAGDVSAINASHENRRYLAGHRLHPELKASNDLAKTVADADALVIGIPSGAFAELLEKLAPIIPQGIPVISLTKGLEPRTGQRMTELIAHYLPEHPFGLLTGPNLAVEILSRGTTAAVLALSDFAIAESLRDSFSTDWFRVQPHRDVIGCELGAALKNVIAIAVGIVDGLSLIHI